ncbi:MULTISPECIES: tail assembly protein [Pasteurellaceae]|uniref:Tail assembly protein n=1 Tax=Pasteurella atlantica TaxID=2827233 RepID=A0AAW8CLX3_9PAST|nr:tail assembly protein [Pasteurella atlantica]MDP8039323.1 tail assembly protein [Pasteurella atlantica]MDP8041415.1 tail assembly protein [Pasteurella atlantica]MDP8043551.1 tail assembly protein [Pasteurella atlantica]MDP8045531.1 tail assembly protein [Pasteurella atlantica]MDP8061384.1 tail assembly protein [Pasteurella atlantica]
MAKIKFHGDLKRFADNKTLELCVDSFSELMSGLLTQIPGLRQHLSKGFYKVRMGKNKYLTQKQIETDPNAIKLNDNATIHFTPVVAGAGKNGGIFSIVVGVILVAASWYVGGAAGWGYIGTQTGATLAFTMGVAMIMSGAVSLLTKPPEMGTGFDDSEKQKSTSFSNLKNITPQGRPIPLLYGTMMTSLVLISQGIETFDEQI